MRKLLLGLALACFCANFSPAQTSDKLAPAVREYVLVDTPVVAISGVRVVDGTGAPPRESQIVILRGGNIEAIGDAKTTPVPAGAHVLEGKGYTVLPGLVGMHNHLFYTAWSSFSPRGGVEEPGVLVSQMSYTFPRLYLAAGVTTMRTTGSIEPHADLYIRKRIDEGKMPGPKMDVTGPYLEGLGTRFPQMHELTGPDDARRLVNYWADQGVTSFKAYMNITRAELAVAIAEAHKRRIKVTGHLCSVTFREAAALGIDDLEHGFLVDTDFNPDKKPDVCPPNTAAYRAAFLKLDPDSPEVQELFHTLIEHHVAVTSTLPVFELNVPGRPPLGSAGGRLALEERALVVMLPKSSISYLKMRAVSHSNPNNNFAAAFKKELELERAFVKAGGLLLAGPDPTGIGGVVAGFGDQREVELLVEAGFTPVEAIHIATANGAEYLGRADHIGTLAAGKAADLVLVKGNPAERIQDIENVELVFKDGVGYDPAKLIESVRGLVGLR